MCIKEDRKAIGISYILQYEEMPVENHIYFIAEDLKPFIDLVDQYSSVLYVTQLLIQRFL